MASHFSGAVGIVAHSVCHATAESPDSSAVVDCIRIEAFTTKQALSQILAGCLEAGGETNPPGQDDPDRSLGIFEEMRKRTESRAGEDLRGHYTTGFCRLSSSSPAPSLRGGLLASKWILRSEVCTLLSPSAH
ncbi:unnamed protein product [Cyprideis torosa]|uniref:Uncharacterized protein n=1 Tax=Cyprideis torosa TaxID=163714 RepID=A0A7R8W4G3_9CRUS|nr:unnamed protein product [Cyprideis torosa]CAG0884169.1 unnamed protein product [Cyprideis torosa]